MMASTLRALLESGRQHNAFTEEGIADVLISSTEIEKKLAAIHRALVAHVVLNTMLGTQAVNQHEQFLDAMKAATEHEVITRREARWLKSFSRAANAAKHSISQSLGMDRGGDVRSGDSHPAASPRVVSDSHPVASPSRVSDSHPVSLPSVRAAAMLRAIARGGAA